MSQDDRIPDARELIAMRAIVAAALKWSDSEGVIFDAKTPEETRDLWAATITYRKLGFTL